MALRDYRLHMRMIGHLRQRYPDVAVALHAGELVAGMVPPEDLRFHIREAIEVAGARRIGHGVSIMHEDDAIGLLELMARRDVLVEINPSSNAVILGVAGADHPLPIYRRFGVPVAISTDDEGVARSEITQEYIRAIRDFDLDYDDLKTISRDSLTYSFLPGASLWVGEDARTYVAACEGPIRQRRRRPPAPPSWRAAPRPPRNGGWSRRSTVSRTACMTTSRAIPTCCSRRRARPPDDLRHGRPRRSPRPRCCRGVRSSGST